MDVFSHALWGGVVAGRKSKKYFWWAFGIGLFPDVASFGILMAAEFLGLLVEHIGPPRPGKRTNMDRTFSWLEAEIQKTKMTKIGSLTPSHKHARGWNVDAGTADIDVKSKG